MTPPIDYVQINSDILHRQDLPCAAKIILGLIQGFGDKGSMLSNSELGRLVGVKPVQVSRLINRMLSDGLIRSKNPKSKYRKLFYIIKNDKVETNLPYHLGQDTLSKKARYFIKNDKHNKRTKEKKKTDFPFTRVETPKHTPEIETPKATPDPEKLKRVMADLGFDTPEAAAI